MVSLRVHLSRGPVQRLPEAVPVARRVLHDGERLRRAADRRAGVRSRQDADRRRRWDGVLQRRERHAGVPDSGPHPGLDPAAGRGAVPLRDLLRRRLGKPCRLPAGLHPDRQLDDPGVVALRLHRWADRRQRRQHRRHGAGVRVRLRPVRVQPPVHRAAVSRHPPGLAGDQADVPAELPELRHPRVDDLRPVRGRGRRPCRRALVGHAPDRSGLLDRARRRHLRTRRRQQPVDGRVGLRRAGQHRDRLLHLGCLDLPVGGVRDASGRGCRPGR